MAGERLRIGELLIEAGVLNHGKLRQALELQRQNARPLGQILVEAGIVAESHLVQALSRQLSLPWVSLWHVDVPPELMDMLSREEAERHRMLPIYVRVVKGEEPSLFVALDDPTDQAALEYMRAKAGMTVKPMIAGPTDLAHAIKALYGGEEEDEGTSDLALLHSSARRPEAPPPPPPPPRRRPPEAAPARSAGEPAPGSSTTAAAGQPPPRQPEVPAAPAVDADAEGAGADAEGATPVPSWPIVAGAPDAGPARVRPRLSRALSFTFLDGTTLSLGGAAEEAGPTADEAPSLAGLIAGLRRHADDPASPEPFGERGAHRVLAAILDVLARKHLIMESEISEALREGRK